MSVRLHAILMVVSMFVAAGFFGLLWSLIGGGLAGFWYVLGFVFVEVVCEEFFTRFVPIRCSNCGGRAQCRFVSRLIEHGQDIGEEPRTVITYQCDDCHRSLSPLPPIRSILGLFVGSFVGVAVFIMVILFAVDPMRVAGEFMADSRLANMIQGILFLAAFFICTISGMVIGSQMGGPATLKKEFDWVAGSGLERLASFVFLLLGTVFCVLGPVILIGNMRLARDGVRTVGVVTKTEIRHDQQEDRAARLPGLHPLENSPTRLKSRLDRFAGRHTTLKGAVLGPVTWQTCCFLDATGDHSKKATLAVNPWM